MEDYTKEEHARAVAKLLADIRALDDSMEHHDRERESAIDRDDRITHERFDTEPFDEATGPMEPMEGGEG